MGALALNDHSADVAEIDRRTASVREAMHMQGKDAIDDEALFEEVRGGNTAAFDTLVERHMRRAFSVAYRLLGQREDAEDLVQDAFMVALQKMDTFEAGRKRVSTRGTTRDVPLSSPCGRPSSTAVTADHCASSDGVDASRPVTG